MDKDTIVEVFKHYTIEPILSIDNIQRGVSKITTTNDKKYIIIINSIDIIKKQYDILSKLKPTNVPVAPVLETMKGMYYVEMNKAYYCLYPFVDGSNINNFYIQEGKKIVSNLGTSIAVLHEGLKQLSYSNDFSSDIFFKRTFDDGLYSICLYEKDNNIISMMKAIVLECKNHQSKFDELPVQIIHGDLHSGNILYGDQRVNAFIDFELSTTGYRMYDLAFLMVDILMQGFQKESDEQWLFLCNKLIENYHKQSTISGAELQTLWHFLLAAQFLIIGYFYRVNVFDEARRHLDGLCWIYKNRDKINKSFMG